jgi:hypothetical protein
VLIEDLLVRAETRVSGAACGGKYVGHGLRTIKTFRWTLDLEIDEGVVAPETSVDSE